LLGEGGGLGLEVLGLDVVALEVGEGGVVLGVAVDPIEDDEVEEADDAGGGEAPAPAYFDEEDADEGDADGGGEFGGGVEDGGGEAALGGGEPEADGFGVGGEGGGFADAEEETGGEEAAEIGSGGGGEGGDAPDEGADAADFFDAEFVEQDTDGKLAEGVGPVVGAGEIAEDDVGDAEGGVEGGVGDGEVDAVEVVDEDAEAEEEGDAPSPAGDGGGGGTGCGEGLAQRGTMGSIYMLLQDAWRKVGCSRWSCEHLCSGLRIARPYRHLERLVIGPDLFGKPRKHLAHRANRRSFDCAQDRLFDCASRNETARRFAQDDNFYINHPLALNLYVDTA
jgi:hypothetical protein